jgi:hypothetical protein
MPGKTVIFSSMVEELLSQSTSSKAPTTGYLYCKYNDPQRNNFTEICRSLIHQLAGNNDICYSYLYDFAANSSERLATRKQDLTQILQNVLQCYDEVFIGIDGLDECEKEERSKVIKLLNELLKLPRSTTSLYIFIASQAVLDIERFMAPKAHTLKIKHEHLSSDIQYYVHGRTAELARLSLTGREMSELNEKVSERSAGESNIASLLNSGLILKRHVSSGEAYF